MKTNMTNSDVYTIDFGSTIIDFYNLYEYVYFTLDMGVDNLEVLIILMYLLMLIIVMVHGVLRQC